MTKLSNMQMKPCPFCGSDSVDIKYDFTADGFQRFFIMCGFCAAKGPTQSHHDNAIMLAHDCWDKRCQEKALADSKPVETDHENVKSEKNDSE